MNPTDQPPRSEVLFIGGRAGSGKSAAAAAMHFRLSASNVKHAVIEGDYLDMAFPHPWEFNLDRTNLRGVWRNYRELGYRRLIYTNTMSVVEYPELAAAMGDDPVVYPVLLTTRDDEVGARLGRREYGDEVGRHVDRSAWAARELDALDDPMISRLDTTTLSPDAVARHLLDVVSWIV